MSLTVLSVAYPFAAVGQDAVGGAEQILTHLDRALVRDGHRSIVVACEGSLTAGMLLATRIPGGAITDELRQLVHREHRANIEHALNHHEIDLIHMHGIDFDRYLPPDGIPALITLHLPPGWYSPRVFHLDRPRTYIHCVSLSQRRECPAGAKLLAEIPNGVPVDDLGMRCSKKRFAVAMGRICAEKNFHEALDAGKMADFPVLLAGHVFPYEAHQRYFHDQILPRLDAKRRFIGPVGFRRKRRLLAGARCLLMPSLAPETSSLVAMEAIACGTPVVAYRSGALPEIVEHGVTGLLVNDAREMAWAIEAAGKLDPAACRETARRRFPLEQMIRGYFGVYHRLARPAETEASVTADPDSRWFHATAGGAG